MLLQGSAATTAFKSLPASVALAGMIVLGRGGGGSHGTSRFVDALTAHDMQKFKVWEGVALKEYRPLIAVGFR